MSDTKGLLMQMAEYLAELERHERVRAMNRYLVPNEGGTLAYRRNVPYRAFERQREMGNEKLGRRGYNSRQVRELMGGRSPATLYRWMHDPRYGFPKPRKVCNSRTNIWDSAEVDAWIAAQLDKQPEGDG